MKIYQFKFTFFFEVFIKDFEKKVKKKIPWPLSANGREPLLHRPRPGSVRAARVQVHSGLGGLLCTDTFKKKIVLGWPDWPGPAPLGQDRPGLDQATFGPCLNKKRKKWKWKFWTRPGPDLIQPEPGPGPWMLHGYKKRIKKKKKEKDKFCTRPWPGLAQLGLGLH